MKFKTFVAITTNLVVIGIPLAVADAATVKTVESTCYNLTGLMYNGKPTHAGAVAVPSGLGYRVGDKIRLIGQRFAGRKTFTVTDKIGWGSQLDLWHPSASYCNRWGRRVIKIKIMKTGKGVAI